MSDAREVLAELVTAINNVASTFIAVDAKFQAQLTAECEKREAAEASEEHLLRVRQHLHATISKLDSQIDALTTANAGLVKLLGEWQENDCFCTNINGVPCECLPCRTGKVLASHSAGSITADSNQ